MKARCGRHDTWAGRQGVRNVTLRNTSRLRRLRSLLSIAVSTQAASHNVEESTVIHRDQTNISQFAASELKVGELIAGRYRIEGLLGVGGMGVVYRAQDESLGVEVALKLLRPEMAIRPEAFERFRQELLMARKVSSPHVVRIHDLVADGERWLISMDYVPGRSLEQRLDAEPIPPVEDTIAIVRQVAQGLAAAHASDIVHRDLKPANILLRDDGHACISDFGVARSAGAVRATMTGTMIGTLDYLSPEQARGEDVGPRSDLYALGLILYEMLSGQRPFEAATAAESLAQRQHRKPLALRKIRPEIPAWLERLVDRLLEANPLRRLRDAEAVVTAIDAQKVARARPRARSLVTATALIVALAGGGWLWQRGVAIGLAPQQTVQKLDLAVLPAIATSNAVVDRDIAEAYSHLINAALLAGNGSVADRDRVDLALDRLGYEPRAAMEHSPRVLAEIGAKRLLAIEARRESDTLAFIFRLYDAAATTPQREARTAALTPEAVGPAIRGALVELGLSRASDELGTVWPQQSEALRAFGHGLSQGRTAAAMKSFAEASTLEPQFAQSWWRQLSIARRLLPERDVVAIAGKAREALRTVRGREADRVRALIALIEGDAPQASERFAPLIASDPHDHQTRLVYAEALESAGDRVAAERELVALTAQDSRDPHAWLLRGQSAIRAGEPQRAVDDYLLRAQLLFTRAQDELGRADTLNALGLGFDLLGQSEPAIVYFREAATLRERLGHARGAASSLRNLAWTHAVAGDAVAAQRDLDAARTLVAPMDDSALLADIANDAGLIAEERGDFGAALPHFRQALQLRERLDDPMGAAEATLNLGFALLRTGRFADAGVHLKSAEHTFREADERTGMTRSLQLLAQLDMARGQLDSAQLQLKQAMRLAEEVNLADERAVLHAEFAELARLQSKREEALSHADRALKAFEAQNDQRGSTEARMRKIAVHIDRNDWAAAERVLKTIPGGARQSGAGSGGGDLSR